MGRHRDDLGGLRLRRRAQLPGPGRVRDRPGGRRHRCGVHLGDDLRVPAPAAEAGEPGGDPGEHVPGARAIRGPATSAWRSWRW